MKICSPQLGISPNSSLGGEIYDYETLKGFTQKNIKVYVYLPHGRNYDKNLSNFYVDYSIFKHIVPPWFFSFICLPYLFRTYRNERFDILRIHSPRFLGLAGVIFHCFYPNVPIISSAVTPKPSTFLFPIEKIIYKISSKIIVQNKFMQNKLSSDFNIQKEKIVVTYGGVAKATNALVTIPEGSKLVNKGGYILLFMGVMVPRKNPAFLIDVLKNLLKDLPNTKLIYLGSGKEVSDVAKKAKINNVEKNVIFIKSAYGSEKNYWFSKMDVFLMPSKGEALGLALVEAMNFGKPVVASNIPPFLEIIENNKNGYVLPLNSKIWAKHIVHLLSSKKLLTNMSQEAKKTVEQNYNWDRMYNLNAEVVESVSK